MKPWRKRRKILCPLTFSLQPIIRNITFQERWHIWRPLYIENSVWVYSNSMLRGRQACHPCSFWKHYTRGDSMKKIVDFRNFSDKKFLTRIFKFCLAYLKEGLLGCTSRYFGWSRTNARSLIYRLKFGTSGPKISEWSEKMGRREPPGGDYARWVRGDLR